MKWHRENKTDRKKRKLMQVNYGRIQANLVAHLDGILEKYLFVETRRKDKIEN